MAKPRFLVTDAMAEIGWDFALAFFSIGNSY